MIHIQFNMRQWVVAVAILGLLLALIERSSNPVFTLVAIYLAAAFPSATLLWFHRTRGFPKLSSGKYVIIACFIILIFSALITSDEIIYATTTLWALWSLLSVPIYVLTRLKFRCRLAIEVVTLSVLVVFSAWIRQHEIYSRHAVRAAHLARLASTWASETDSPRDRVLLESESEWFARKARLYRCKALEYGLIRTLLPGYARLTGDDRELILDLGISQVMDWREADILHEHERLGAVPQTGRP